MGNNLQRRFIENKGRQDLLLLLKSTQLRFGYLSEEYMREVADSLGISVSEVYGVATFYSFLSTRPGGRNTIRVCKGLPCCLKDTNLIISSTEDTLGIKPGETTGDGRFSLELTNCIGACDAAPAMLVNDDLHTDLTVRKIAQILRQYD